MKIALLITDNREPSKQHGLAEPIFGAAPAALLQGFAALPEIEVHVVSCLRQPVRSPEKLAPNIFYHSVVVPKFGWMRTGYQGCIRATRRKLREIQPDIVHGQGTELHCGISAVFSGCPNVLTIHGNMRSVATYYAARPGSFLWLAARLEAFTLRRTGGVFCNSAYTEELVSPLLKATAWRMFKSPIRLSEMPCQRAAASAAASPAFCVRALRCNTVCTSKIQTMTTARMRSAMIMKIMV